MQLPKIVQTAGRGPTWLPSLALFFFTSLMPCVLSTVLHMDSAMTAARLCNGLRGGGGDLNPAHPVDVGALRQALRSCAVGETALSDWRETQDTDIMDRANQERIESEIQKANVEENLKLALEHNPEAFGTISMLKVLCEINRCPVIAMVDSGAQATIMSAACAERLGIMRLVDRRFAGLARGVGQQKIVGRVHVVPLKVGNAFISISVSVLEGGVDFLFGLDNLRRHQCLIDLEKNVLCIADQEVHFLSESDIAELESSGTVVGDMEIKQRTQPEQQVRSRLVEMGFTIQRVEAALQAADGNEHLAAELLVAEGE